jgi:diacylglycerol kinase (ATP)
MIPRRRFAAIVNPVSGRRSMFPRVRRIQELIEDRGGSLEILETQGPGHAEQLAGAVSREVQALIVAGGDGTVGEVVNGLHGRALPTLIFRAGTENLLARELKMPSEPARIVDALEQGEPTQADLGEINGRRFLAIAGFGFDAECVQRMSLARRGHITHFDYFWPIWRTFWAHRFPRLEIEVDGQLCFSGRGLALVGNIPRYSIGLRVVQDAKTDDGLLDLGVFPCSTRAQLIRHACRTSLGWHVRHGRFIYRQFRALCVRSPDPVPIEIDGELGGYVPAQCAVLPRAFMYLR